jgi:predicted ribonuclease YlaK
MAKRYTMRDEDDLQSPSPKLKALIRDLMDEDKRIILVDGLPSTGKTYQAFRCGIAQLGRPYQKVVYGRPIEKDNIGFLPGEVEDKMLLYIAQIREYTQSCTFTDMDTLLKDGTLEVLPLETIQGRRFRRTFVVMDEVQNVHWRKTYKTLSRGGEGGKLVLIGDTSPGQENSKVRKNSMLHFCRQVFANDPYVAVHDFHDVDNDIMGDDFNKHILKTLLPYFGDGGEDAWLNERDGLN